MILIFIINYVIFIYFGRNCNSVITYISRKDYCYMTLKVKSITFSYVEEPWSRGGYVVYTQIIKNHIITQVLIVAYGRINFELFVHSF